MRPPAALLVSLLAGLALGAAGACVIRKQLAAPPAPDSLTPVNATSARGAPSSPGTALLLQPRLAADEADDALDAWLALGEPVDDAAPADFATQSAALRALLTILPTEALPRLVEALLARVGDDTARLRHLAFDVWIERDPAQAARWAVAHAPATTDPLAKNPLWRLRDGAARAWARLDFDSAYAWATTLANTTLSENLARQLIQQLAATDPARALTLAQARGDEFLKTTERELFNLWAKLDPVTALHTLGPALLQTDNHSWSVQQALGSWLGRDPHAALVWIDTQSRFAPDDASSILRSLLRNISHTNAIPDPRPVADALANQPDRRNQLRDLSALLHGWMSKDPVAAAAWAQALPDPTQRADLLDRVIPSDHPDLRDPDRYLPLALGLPEGANRDEKLAGLLSAWARTDPEAALAWIAKTDDPSIATATHRVEATLLGALASADPAAALSRWQSLPEGPAKSSAITEIATAWAKHDPAAATRFLGEHLPAQGDINHEIWSSTVYTWSRQEPLAALRWAESLATPRHRDDALLALGGTWEDVPDHAAHATLLGQIADPRLRFKQLAQHLVHWMSADELAAREWIEADDTLTPEQAAQLLARPAKK